MTAATRIDYFNNRYDNKLSSALFTSNSTIVSPKLNFNYRLNDRVQFYLYNGKASIVTIQEWLCNKWEEGIATGLRH